MEYTLTKMDFFLVFRSFFTNFATSYVYINIE